MAMNLFNLFRRARPSASAGDNFAGQSFSGLNDPAFLEYVRSGNAGGVTVEQALKNPAVLRSVGLITNTIGRLPLVMMRHGENGEKTPAVDHPLYPLFRFKPNNWQNAMQFKQLMELWALVHGNAYAIIVRSIGRVIQLQPVHPSRVTVEQGADWSLSYKISRSGAASTTMPAQDVFHLRGISDDGISGVSRVQVAADTITVAVHARRAARRIFENGMMVGGNLHHPNKLSNEAYERLKASMAERAGPEHAGKWIITEEGMTATPFANTAVDSQLVEMSSTLVEEIGRIFDVPRPFLFLDDTSWGSGIEQLAIQFVQTGLAPWFTAWEDEIALKLLPPAEWGAVYADFDETELLRGTSKDQGEFFAKAAGAGGHQPWMTANEIRTAVGLGSHADGDSLTPAGGKNVASQTA